MFKNKKKNLKKEFDVNGFLSFIDLNNYTELGERYKLLKDVFHSNGFPPLYFNYKYVGGEYTMLNWSFIRDDDIIGICFKVPDIANNGVSFSCNIISKCYNLSSVFDFIKDLKMSKYDGILNFD